MSFDDFSCLDASPEKCGLNKTREVPFSLKEMDNVWIKRYGELPTKDQLVDFFYEHWRYFVAKRERRVRSKPKQPTKARLRRSSLSRRQFYCWHIKNRQHSGFCRDLKLLKMKVTPLNRKEEKVCQNKQKCMALNPLLYPKTDILARLWYKVGGRPPLKHKQKGRGRGRKSHFGGRRGFYCAMMRSAASSKVKSAYCHEVAKLVKPPIVYPSLSLSPEEYRKQIDKIFAKYKYSVPNLVNGCSRDTNKMLTLAPQQKFVKNYMTIKNPLKGLLLWHAAGTGKTCAAISIASTFLSGDWGDEWDILWVTRPTLVMEPVKAMFEDTCWGPLREAIKSDRTGFGMGGETADTYEEKLAYAKNQSNWDYLRRRFAKNFPKRRIIKYSQMVGAAGRLTQLGRSLTHSMPDPLRNTLLVFDEAHNLFNVIDLPPSERRYMNQKRRSPFSGKTVTGRELIVEAIWNSYKVSGENSCRVLLVTATPMTSGPTDLFRLLNILIPKEDDRLSLDASQYMTEEGKKEFEDKAKGLISYFSGDRDPRYFAMKRWDGLDKVPVSPVQEDYFEKCKEKDKASCYRNVANMAALRGKLKVPKSEVEELKRQHAEEYEELKRLARIKCGEKKDEYDRKYWSRERAAQDKWNREEATRLASGKKPRKPRKSYVYRVPKAVTNCKMPKEKEFKAPKDGKSFSFTFDGTRWTPDVLANNLKEYGPKLYALLHKIRELDETDLREHGRLFKHTIYTDTSKRGYGAKIVAAAFIAFGYDRACHYKTRGRVTVLEPPKASEKCDRGPSPSLGDRNLMERTFGLLSSTAVNGKPRTDKRTKATIDLFNRDGVRFMILDAGFKEGVSLKNVRYTHLLEPPLSQSSYKQAVARSARRCKSQQLKPYDMPPKGWTLGVYVYGSEFDDGESVHKVVLDNTEGADQMRMMDDFENLSMKSAVDYNLNRAILEYNPPDMVDAIEEGKRVMHL